MSPVVCNRQHLHDSTQLSVDNGKREPAQADLTKVGWANHLVPMGGLNGLADGLHRGSMVTTAKSDASIFVVGDLPFVLQCRLWMQLEGHFRRA